MGIQIYSYYTFATKEKKLKIVKFVMRKTIDIEASKLLKIIRQ